MTSTPSSSKALFDQALALHQQGQLAQAKALYLEALEHQPQHFDSLHMLGVLTLQLGHAQESLEWMRQAMEIKSDHADLYINLGSTLQQLNENETALVCYDTAATLAPHAAPIYFNKANLLKKLGRVILAIEHYQKAITLNPNYASARTNLGLCQLDQHQTQEALEQFEIVKTLTPQDPLAHHNLANALKALERWDDALQSYTQALSLHPQHIATLYNQGTTLQEMLRLDEAIACYQQVIELDAQHAKAHWNLSICWLLLGHFEKAWPLYAWRWRVPENHLSRPTLDAPLWRGQPLAQQTLLLYAEQGLGDSIQFCRYLPLLEQLGARVILQIPQTLHALFEQRPNIEVITPQDPPSSYDFQCALLDLPQIFQTTSTDIPPPLSSFRANNLNVTQWVNRLANHQRPKIGLVWQGSKHHVNDAKRSIPLELLIEYLPTGPQYISLQKEISAQELEVLDRSGILHFENELHHFADTAALASCMQTVISVDTSVAHLCGALGIPTLVLLPYIADWRWLAHGQHSLWYPAMELIRQDASRKWHSALAQLTQHERLNP